LCGYDLNWGHERIPRESAQAAARISASEEGILGGHIGARGYFCCSGGNATDEVVAEYIEMQGWNEDGNFKIERGRPSEWEPPFDLSLLQAG